MLFTKIFLNHWFVSLISDTGYGKKKYQKVENDTNKYQAKNQKVCKTIKV